MKFDIEAPVLSESLILEARRRHWLHASAYLGAACALLMLGIGALAFPGLSQHLGDARLSLGVIVAFLGIPAAYYSASCADEAVRCSPISAGLCLDALKLTEKHPELEAYRQTVVASRPVMEGDYYAMLDFSNGNPMRAACEALHKLN